MARPSTLRQKTVNRTSYWVVRAGGTQKYLGRVDQVGSPEEPSEIPARCLGLETGAALGTANLLPAELRLVSDLRIIRDLASGNEARIDVHLLTSLLCLRDGGRVDVGPLLSSCCLEQTVETRA